MGDPGRVHIDRAACAWLIRRHLDPDAQILYVPADQVLAVAHRVRSGARD